MQLKVILQPCLLGRSLPPSRLGSWVSQSPYPHTKNLRWDIYWQAGLLSSCTWFSHVANSCPDHLDHLDHFLRSPCMTQKVHWQSGACGWHRWLSIGLPLRPRSHGSWVRVLPYLNIKHPNIGLARALLRVNTSPASLSFSLCSLWDSLSLSAPCSLVPSLSKKYIYNK